MHRDPYWQRCGVPSEISPFAACPSPFHGRVMPHVTAANRCQPPLAEVLMMSMARADQPRRTAQSRSGLAGPAQAAGNTLCARRAALASCQRDRYFGRHCRRYGRSLPFFGRPALGVRPVRRPISLRGAEGRQRDAFAALRGAGQRRMIPFRSRAHHTQQHSPTDAACCIGRPR